MSDDENATTSSGGHQSSTEQDSIIGKMRSKVTNILPETISKWFSPVSGEKGNRNGNLRRRRDNSNNDEDDRDDDGSTDDGNDSDNDESGTSMPPSKRTKLNASEEYMNPYTISSSIKSREFYSSTPTTPNRKRNLNLLKNEKGPPYVFQYTQPSHISSNTDEPRCIDEDMPDSDVLEVIPEHEEPAWDSSRVISSRRSLNIPSSSKTIQLPSLHRQAVFTTRTGLTPRKRSLSSLNDQTEEDLREVDEDDNSEGDNDKTRKNICGKGVLTNGKVSNVISGDTGSESGDSQCSSLQRQRPSGLFGARTKSFRSSGGVGLNFYSHLEGKKSLFSEKNMANTLNSSTISLTSLNRRQSFNASLYGSTSALSDSRLLNMSSPFYKGQTTFGGASAYSKHSHHLQNISRTPTSIRPSSSLSTLSSSNNSLAQGTDITAPISSTAKRILELMNQFTTPLSDAKKMANTIKVPAITDHKKRFDDEELRKCRAIRMTTPKTPYSRPMPVLPASTSKLLAPPTNELQVPSMANLLQMKKLQNNTEKVREIANSSKSVLNTEEEYKLPTEIQKTDSSSKTKHTSKIRHKTSNSKNTAENMETLIPANLPAIPLPLMKSVPKIDISISKPSQTTVSTSTSVSPQNKSNVEYSIFDSVIKPMATSASASTSFFSKPSTVNTSVKDFSSNSSSTTIKSITQESEFKFSMPTSVTNAEHVIAESIDKYKFSKPIVLNEVNRPSQSGSVNENFKFQLPEKLKPKETDKVDTIQAKSMPQLKSGSVLDVLSKESNPISVGKPDSTGFGEQFKMTENKWECSICMIRNDNSLKECAACQTARKEDNSKFLTTSTPGEAAFGANNQKNDEVKNSFGDLFKPKGDSWECPVCMISNKNELKECAACKAIKPGDKSSAVLSVSSSVPKTVTDTGFKNLVAQQVAKWECVACMTYNEQNQLNCVCCDHKKPGSESESHNDLKPSFGTSSKFTFGFVTQKEEDLKQNRGKTATVTSSSLLEEKDKVDGNRKGFSFGSGAVSSSTLSTVQGSGQSTATIKSPDMSQKSSNKDSANVSSSSFKFGTIQNTNATSQSTATFTFGTSKPTLSDSSSDQPTKINTTTSFKFGFPATSAEDKKEKKTETKSEASVVQPQVESKLNFGTTTNVATTAVRNEPKDTTLSGFPSGISSFAQKPDSTADSKGLFAFGSSGKPVSSGNEKKLNFSFGGENSSKSTISAFSSPTIQKSDNESSKLQSFGTSQTTSTSVAVTSSPSTSIFGKPSLPTATTTTPLLGTGKVSSSSVTSTTLSMPLHEPLFGAAALSSTASTGSIFGGSLNKDILFGKPSIPPQQNSIFGGSNSASNNNTLQNNNQSSTNLFTFGAAKTESSTPIFGSVSSTTSKQFSFGSNPTTTASSTPFLFGEASTQKAPETTSLFGSATGNSSGITSNTPLPSLSGFPGATKTNSQLSDTTSTFGQPSNVAASAPASLFSSTGNNAPTFGTNMSSTSIFGSSTPAFSNPVSFGTNNNTVFGSAAATPAALPSFGNSFSSDNAAIAKKSEPAFNFGAPVQSSSTGGFSFGANNNNSNQQQQTQPFSFSAAAAPLFNFSGSQEAANTTQPFQFGAVPITPSFNFSGIETASNAPFQFSAPANNIFAPTPIPGSPTTTGSQQQNRRKMRARRTQPR